MAAKKVTKKKAKKTAGKTAKKAPAKKAAVKKTAKKAPKKKTKRKKAVKKSRATAVVPSETEIRQRAYLNYCDRLAKGLPGSALGDWLDAERQVAA